MLPITRALIVNPFSELGVIFSLIRVKLVVLGMTMRKLFLHIAHVFKMKIFEKCFWCDRGTTRGS